MHRTYDKLYLMCLTAEQREQTCSYWYTITSNMLPFTAFRTRAALLRFLERHQLSFAGTLPEAYGQHATFALEGDVRQRMVASRADLPEGQRVLHMSNGDYTTGIMAPMNGKPGVWFVGPNGDRDKIDHNLGRATEDAGKDYPDFT